MASALSFTSLYLILRSVVSTHVRPLVKCSQVVALVSANTTRLFLDFEDVMRIRIDVFFEIPVVQKSRLNC